MKKIFINTYLIVITLSCSAQNTVKDSLFFEDNSNYLELKINYENNHRFFFKNEKFVSSAIYGIINDEKMNHFAQAYKSTILKNLKPKPKKIYDIKEYLYAHRKELVHDKVDKFDSYKLMLHFDKFHVFIKNNNYFVKVIYITQLSE